MNSRRIILLLLLTSCIIFLLILKIISYKNSINHLENNYNILLKSENLANENTKLLIQWTKVQNILWLSYLKDFGSLLSRNSSDFADNQINSNRKLVYWFSNSQACSTCVDTNIDLLKSIADSVGFNHILVISDFKDEREINLFESKYQLSKLSARFELGKAATSLTSRAYLNHLFFILNENDQILFPTFIDERFRFSRSTFQSALHYLTSK